MARTKVCKWICGYMHIQVDIASESIVVLGVHFCCSSWKYTLVKRFLNRCTRFSSLHLTDVCVALLELLVVFSVCEVAFSKTVLPCTSVRVSVCYSHLSFGLLVLIHIGFFQALCFVIALGEKLIRKGAYRPWNHVRFLETKVEMYVNYKAHVCFSGLLSFVLPLYISMTYL